MERDRVGIVIPAFNEAGTVGSVVCSASEHGVCIVVDDGSSDETGVVASGAGAVVVTHIQNSGYDSALNSGFAKASEIGCEIVLTLDADGQHDAFLLSEFLRRINDGAWVVVGVRNKMQRFSEKVFGLYTNLRFGIPDPLCGLKAYRIEIYREQGFFDSYGSIGTQLMLFAAKQEMQISTVSFQTRERVGQPRFGSRFFANLKIFRALVIGLLHIR